MQQGSLIGDMLNRLERHDDVHRLARNACVVAGRTAEFDARGHVLRAGVFDRLWIAVNTDDFAGLSRAQQQLRSVARSAGDIGDDLSGDGLGGKPVTR